MTNTRTPAEIMTEMLSAPESKVEELGKEFREAQANAESHDEATRASRTREGRGGSKPRP